MIATYYNKDIGQEYQFNNNELLLTFYDIYGIDEPKSVPMVIDKKYLDEFISILQDKGFKKEAI
jgi:hypothetical protein